MFKENVLANNAQISDSMAHIGRHVRPLDQEKAKATVWAFKNQAAPLVCHEGHIKASLGQELDRIFLNPSLGQGNSNLTHLPSPSFPPSPGRSS